MRVIESVDDIKLATRSARCDGKTVGFVPTMGFFHEGHLSLMRAARAENYLVVVSLFVNPTQFGPNEDLERYPRDRNRDVELAMGAGTDLLFIPRAEDIYPPDDCTRVVVRGLSEKLCGASRPGHFEGVATVVAKLFNMIAPHRAYFGLKDYQQTVVIRRMVRDLHLDVDIVTLPTVREDDGLALSSRNSYLSPRERRAARCLKESLDLAERKIHAGERQGDQIRGNIRERIGREKLARIDYVSVSHPQTLDEVSQISGDVMISVAVHIGETRLIDNLLVKVAA